MLDLVRQVHALAGSLRLDEADAVLGRGLADGRDEAPAQLIVEARCVAAHRADVAGDSDAAALVVQAGDRLVELVEGGLLAEEQVDVVDQQQVELAVAGAEGGAGLAADRGCELVEELLGADEEERAPRAAAAWAMACRRCVLPLPAAPVMNSGE